MSATLVGCVGLTQPAEAMCGGNIFMTCPANPKAAAATKRDEQKRAKRMARHRKRHYPIRMR